MVEPIQAGSGADAVTTGAAAVWVANSLDGTVTRIDPATNTVRATIPVGDGPNGIAVVDGAVWVSNELAGTLSRIDPASGTRRPTGEDREPARRARRRLRSALRRRARLGRRPRGGTLTRADRDPATSSNVDPARAYSLADGQVLVLTNDGLTGFRRVGGSAGLELVPDLAVSLPAPTDGGRSYSFQLRPGIHYSTGALVRPQDFRRAIERTLELRPGRTAPYYAGIVGARRCLAAPKRPCDLSQGIVTDAGSNTVTFHLASPDPDFLYELALPSAYAVPAGTPLHPHGFAACHRPVRDRLVRPEARHPARPQPEVSRVVAGGPAERLPRRDRRALTGLGRTRTSPRSSHGSADLASR